MKLARKAIITIMTTLALLAGVSAAAATTASAATAAPSLTPSVTWYYWSSYGTLHACDAEGEHLFTSEEILHYKCPRYNKGDYFVWELYVILGHPPGS